MAELDFDSYDTDAVGNRSEQLSRMINLTGAACSIALVVGLGVWGYRLAMRDVNGVPVMRALAGPMREMPQVPGGDVASHQGLSVNAVAAVGTAAALPDQVLLAPAPVDLAAEDAPGLGIVADPALQPQVEVGASTISPVTLSTDSSEPLQTIDADAAVAMALADALAAGAEPFSELASGTAPPDLAAAVMVRPRPRPAQTSVADVSAAVTVPSIAPVEIDPATLAVGTRLVQLGAFDNDADARAEWARLQTRFGDLLATKSMVVQAAQSGGRTFYRLRAHGFADEDDARQFCAVLVAGNAPCIPALHR